MPTLKQISCSLEIGPNGTKLKEYDHKYTDGGVEAFVAVPDSDIPFHVRVISNGYIAPGLAAYVFMDGQYQCNRNRQRLQLPSPGMDPREYEVDFQLRQREEKTSRGQFVAREWTFAQLKTGNADSAPDVNKHFAHNVGTIEVVILRCRGAHYQSLLPPPVPPQSKPASVAKAPSAKAPSNAPAKAPSKAPSKAASKAKSDAGGGMFGDIFGVFDGAGDEPDHDFQGGLDGAYDEPDSAGRYAPDYFGRRPVRPDYEWDTKTGIYRRDRAFDGPPRVYGPVDTPEGYERMGAFQPRAQDHQRPQTMQTQRLRNDFDFIEEACKEIENLLQQGIAEAKKHASMDEEAYARRGDPDMYPVILRALQRKAQDVRRLNQEIEALYKAVNSRMMQMDRHAYERVRNFLLDRRLLPEVQINLPNAPFDTPIPEQRPPPQKQFERPSTTFDNAPPRERDWREIGQGDIGGERNMPLWKRKQLQYSQEHTPQSRPDAAWRGQLQSRQNSGQTAGWAQSPRHSSDRPWGAPADGWGMSNQQDDYDMDGTNKHTTPQGSDGRGWGEPVPGSFPTPPADEWGHKDDSWGSGKGNSPQKNDDAQAGNDSWDADQGGDAGGGWSGDQGKNEAQGNDTWGDTKQNDSGGADQGGWNDDKPQGDSFNNGSGDQNADENNGGGDGFRQDDAGDEGGQDEWNNDQGGGGDNGFGDQAQDAGNGRDSWGQEEAKDEGNGGGAWGGEQANNQADGGGDWGEAKNDQPAKSAPAAWGNDGAKSTHSRATAASSASGLRPVIKDYWSNWNGGPPTSKPKIQPRDAYVYPAPPPPAASKSVADAASQYIQPGRGASYAHKIDRPEYLDTMNQPYAIFTFKYRSKCALEKILKRNIDTSNIKRAVQEAEQERLMRLPKDELVAELMKRQTVSKATSRVTSNKPASNVGGWGNDIQKTPQASNAWGAKSATKAATQPGWGAGGGEEVKPSDSVSQKGDGDGWQEFGQGEVNNDAWGNIAGGKSKQASKAASGWANNYAGASKKASQNGNGGWAADQGGNDGWDKKSNKTVEHFDSADPALEGTGGKDEKAAWGAAGWQT